MMKATTSVLPRSIASKAAFHNAMSLDVAMGGSTNTVLHILAIAHEAGADFTLKDIDAISRKIPVLCKVSPNSNYHIQDVNRAGGILGILSELASGGLIDTSAKRVDGLTLAEAIDRFDLRKETCTDEARAVYSAAPFGGRNLVMGSQQARYREFDLDRTGGCIRDIGHAYSADGGLAVLYGNIARNGCIVKTAGVKASILKFSGPARVFDSQDTACDGILDKTG